MRILFVSAEAHPLVKTGGLGDVCGSLPQALTLLDHDVRIVLPAYRQVVERAGPLRPVATVSFHGAPDVRLLEGRFPGSSVRLYLIDSPAHFDRPGHPYVGPDGQEYADNAQRFAAFSRAVVALALGRLDPRWAPELVHCHDWHTGLVPALLSREPTRPATVFTIHNLAYQGLYTHETFQQLGLPAELWSMQGLEFHGQLSFIKGGLVFSDWLTTVSPTYAEEIQTEAMGCGLDGLLRHRHERLVGILNGADYESWDPRRDPWIAEPYGPGDLAAKAANKADLQRRFDLPSAPRTPLFASVHRLVEQKGVDLLIDALPDLAERPLQVVVVGEGEGRFGRALEEVAAAFPERVAVRVGYTEELAHRVLAGADGFLMPSRFEPCGLTQLYALRYGAVPVVRRTGGLADTIHDTHLESLLSGAASGFTFDAASRAGLVDAVDRAVDCYQWAPVWERLVRTCMTRDFGWGRSAHRYTELYGVGAPRRVHAGLGRYYALATHGTITFTDGSVVRALRPAEVLTSP